MDAPYSRLSSPYLAWLVVRDAALSKMSATNLYTSSLDTSSRARITAPTATVVVSVCSAVTSPLSSFLSPQATRLSAMTSARTSAKSFFMFFLLVDMVFFPENCYFRRPAPGPRYSTVPLYRRSKVFAISKCAKFHFSLRPAPIHPAARRRFPPFVPTNSTFCLYQRTFYPSVFYSAKPFHAGCSCMNCIFCCSLLQNSKGGATPRL